MEFVVGSFTNVTNDCLRASISRGAHTLDRPLRDSQLQLTMTNNHDAYSPLNATSSYYGLLRVNTAVKFTCFYDTTSYFLFNGNIRQINVNPDHPKTATITAADGISGLLRQNTKSTLYRDSPASSIFASLMNNTAIASYQIVGQFSDVVPYAWWRNVSTAKAIRDLVEFGNYWVYQTADNILTLQSRYFNNTGTITKSYNEFNGFSFTYNDSNVVNTQIIKSSGRRRLTDVRTIAWIEPDHIFIPSFEKVSFWMDYVDPDTLEQDTPAQNVRKPIVNVDYNAFSERNQKGYDRSQNLILSFTPFASTAICSIWNVSGNDVYLSLFTVKGQSLQRLPNINAQTNDSSSENVYGDRQSVLDNKLISDYSYAKAYTEFLIDEKKEPKGNLSVSIKNIYPDILSLELSDVIHINESSTGVNSNFVITELNHEINLTSGVEHELTIDFINYPQRDLFLLDNDPEGKLGGSRKMGF